MGPLFTGRASTTEFLIHKMASSVTLTTSYAQVSLCQIYCPTWTNVKMPITTNENYSCWVHKMFEHVQNFHTGLPKLHAREEHFELIVTVIVIARMTRNDHPNKLESSIRAHSAQWDLGIIFNSICYLTVVTIYDAVLSPSLLCIYTCLASDFSSKFNIYFKKDSSSIASILIYKNIVHDLDVSYQYGFKKD